MYCRRDILSSDKKRNLELSEIVHMLEDSGTFVEVAQRILERVVSETGADSAGIMQIGADGRTMNMIVEAGTIKKAVDIGMVDVQEFVIVLLVVLSVL